ncbi:MAG: hypothetical protein ACO1NO_09435 [Burkholderiaceae bacterium]
MQIYYRSYLEFLIKADLLARDLALTPKEATELLAGISGHEDYRSMPIGKENAEPLSPSFMHEELIVRLMALRPDISPRRASDIVTRLKLTGSIDSTEHCPERERPAQANT